ncbi:UNVERIFIED_CONTAM: hypothetical protein GTU68_059333 [Idotea baltica]|nr:hypothetical protein [Idotea baltica]
MIKIGDTFEQTFQYTQADVEIFAEVSNDKNPIHLDEEYAAQTSFGKRIIHGMLSASIFSKVLAMDFPGEGTIYLHQSLDFKRAMFVDQEYLVKLTVLEIVERRHTAEIQTQVFSQENGKIMLDGKARIMNKEKI